MTSPVGSPRAPRIVIVGGGIAGLYCALAVRAADPSSTVTVLVKTVAQDGNTWHAQGGIAAVLPGSQPAAGPADSIQDHVADTLLAGAGLCDPPAVRILCAAAPEQISRLLGLGVPFDRAGGALATAREAAHRAARILHVHGDSTGAGLMGALWQAVRSDARIVVQEHCLVTGILARDDGVIAGLRLLAGEQAVPETMAADVVVLATGGAGQLFERNTNPAVATADGVGLAWRAGAVLSDVEFFQFHPTALDVPGAPLISEAVRGAGAVLVDAAGRRFMPDYHQGAELAPRDVVSRSIATHLASSGEPRVYLDATGLGRAFLRRRFPALTAVIAGHGFDWAREPVPVAPAAHYWMGGVRTDSTGRTSLRGLYAVGEAARTGVHGANRLASNSLLEAVVFAERAARSITGADMEPWPAFESEAIELPSSGAAETFTRRQLQQLMSDHAGVVRSASGLGIASKQLAQFSRAPQTRSGWEQENLVTAAQLLVHAATQRRESRGAHYRSDFPSTLSAGAATGTSYRLAAEGATP